MTIVVLLILAGVTINIVFSENGIIKKVQEAAGKTDNATTNEQKQINELGNHIDNMINGGNSSGGGSDSEEGENNPGGGSSSDGPTVSLPSDGSYSEIVKVNTPDLGEGMTPIVWDDSSKQWVETESNNKWYDYSNKKWANARTADGSMWVWIPRFAYKITSGYHQSGADINSDDGADGVNSAGTIEVEFMKGTSNEGATGKTLVEYNSTTTNNYTNFPNGYVIHPAFTYGETVSGIWVAKFEASPEGATTDKANSQYNGTSKKLQVKPGVSSWREITASNMYDVCINYNKTLNSHMMKNDEWGAVAYLSKSKYGKENEKVWINNSSSFITGSAGNSASARTDIGTTNDYTSSQGVKASTTGNVYGIYDMSGGAYEYVAAYVNNGNKNLTNNGKSLYQGDAKTKNVYAVASSDSYTNNYNQNAGKYGDAVYETSGVGNTNNGSWYGNYSSFPYTSDPFFIRGGYYGNGSVAGVFSFTNYDGNRYSIYYSFRPVLVAL